MSDLSRSACEIVVLLDEDGSPTGTMPKADVHHADTPLHLAFSSYIFTPDHRLLLTRRALTKVAWPGVWTNSCCGHPDATETPEEAAQRRIGQELNLTAPTLETVLPHFKYRATDVSGVVEHEICPVFAGVTPQAHLTPNPQEVCDWAWVPWTNVVLMAIESPALLSPWAVLQIQELIDRGWSPRHLGQSAQ